MNLKKKSMYLIHNNNYTRMHMHYIYIYMDTIYSLFILEKL